jgi:uncharacterized repeat protein (TIGR02543 family)
MMNGDKTVHAFFARVYTLRTGATPSAGGTVRADPNPLFYDPGTVVTLTAMPAVGYKFSGWSGDLSGTANPATITMYANKTVVATFLPAITALLPPGSTYVLTTTTSASAGGTVTKTPDQATYTSGTVVTLTATPASGYTFTGWSGGLSGTTNPVAITMDANKTVTATFTLNTQREIELTIGSSTMYVDGSPVVLEAAPIILNSRTLLPIRAVVEATGGTIAWEASTQNVTIVRKDTTLELWIGSGEANLNGQLVSIDSDPMVIPIIMNGRTLLPLRFVAEALALDIQWDAAVQKITITYTS